MAIGRRSHAAARLLLSFNFHPLNDVIAQNKHESLNATEQNFSENSYRGMHLVCNRLRCNQSHAHMNTNSVKFREQSSQFNRN